MKISQFVPILAVYWTAIGLAACAADGSFATKAKPIDYAVSLQRTCTGLKGLDAVFKGVAPSLVAAGKLDASAIEIETATVKVLSDACDPNKPPTDLPGAVALVAVASVDMGNLVAVLSQ